MINRLHLLAIVTFIFIINFDTNHYQIGIERHRRQTPSCNIAGLPGTTQQIKDIVIGRCYYFINVLQKNNCYFDSKKYNCNTVWDLFYSASLTNSRNISDYKNFLDSVDQDIPENTSLFWSGTYNQAHECKFNILLYFERILNKQFLLRY